MIMESSTRIIGTMCIVSALVAACLFCFTIATPASGEEAIDQAEQIEAMRDEAAREKREAAERAKREKLDKAKAKLEEEIEKIDLPIDSTQRLSVRELRISGNTLITTEELLAEMPLIFNASDKPLAEAESAFLYDFRVLHDIVLDPGRTRQVSARTIQGLTQYILSVYQEKNYAGIYVYVPSEAVREGVELRDEILPINVLEAAVTDVTITTYDPNQNETEEAYLRRSAVMEWSPVKVGQVANQKELDDFVNLLNLNPDRYVSAVVTKGREPESLAVAYDIYEANPWHWFIQVDNSGTQERQWNPRIGVINTNLLGIDDIFTAIYQAPWDTTINENYALYGSYDFPLAGPRLRLNVYGGYSEFDISPESGAFNFLGRGDFYGGVLRYNLLQTDGWFVDLKGTVEHTRSKVSPLPFPVAGSDVKFWIGGAGIDLHREDDLSRTSLTFDQYKSLGGESGGDEFRAARTNAESLFTIYSATAAHSQYLDPNEVQRVSASLRWVGSDERLVPAKMTSFGGMYSVRGYDEYEFVADGGILASIQYEFDVVKQEESLMTAGEKQLQQEASKPTLRKLAPLVFFDYGRPKIRHPIGLEKGHEELMSVGTGAIVELGDNFTGAVYYGYPLGPTDDTRTGKGRLNVGLLWRW
jgi:hemolysin activation/secretion protein